MHSTEETKNLQFTTITQENSITRMNFALQEPFRT